VVAGIADVEDFRHQTGIQIESGPYDTVGGYVLARLGHIPETGESVTAHNAMFLVTECDDVHVKQIRVRPPQRRSAE
jgi:putative hemolysin